jgi:hypothetical protein
MGSYEDVLLRPEFGFAPDMVEHLLIFSCNPASGFTR